MRKIALALATAAALVVTAPAQATTTLISEDFETGFGVFSNTGQVGINSGQDYVNCCGATGSQASRDNHFASFGSGNNPSGTISTTVNLAAGDTFVLAFDYGAGGAGTEPLLVTFDGITYTYDPVATGDLDTTFTHAIIAGLVVGAQPTLSFTSGGLANVDSFIDNVVVSGPDIPGVPSIPEPTSWAMMLLGFGAIGYQIRRTRRVRLNYKAA